MEDAPKEIEIDDHKLGQRQKQLDFGKNTLGYQMCVNTVPRPSSPSLGDSMADPRSPACVTAWQTPDPQLHGRPPSPSLGDSMADPRAPAWVTAWQTPEPQLGDSMTDPQAPAWVTAWQTPEPQLG
eukprot:gene10106-8006_t